MLISLDFHEAEIRNVLRIFPFAQGVQKHVRAFDETAEHGHRFFRHTRVRG